MILLVTALKQPCFEHMLVLVLYLSSAGMQLTLSLQCDVGEEYFYKKCKENLLDFIMHMWMPPFLTSLEVTDIQ